MWQPQDRCRKGLVFHQQIAELWHGLPLTAGLSPWAWEPAIPGEDWLLRHRGWEVFLGMTVLSLEFCTISELCFRHHCHSWVQPGWTKAKHNSWRYAFLSIFSQICSLLTERHHPTLRNTEVKLNYFGNLMHFRMGAQVWTGCFCHLWIKHR